VKAIVLPGGASPGQSGVMKRINVALMVMAAAGLAAVLFAVSATAKSNTNPIA